MSDNNEPIVLPLKQQVIDVPGKAPRRTITEWSVLGFTTTNESDVKKAKSALVLHENVSGLRCVMRSIKELNSAALLISSKGKVYPEGSEAELVAKALSEKIECFRAELFHDYLDLVTDPEFLIAAVKLGDRVNISDNSLNKDSE
jgi:hypothetical protein